MRPISFLLCLALAPRRAARRLDTRAFTLQANQSFDLPASWSSSHEEIKGFMPAMTMPHEVRDLKVLDGLVPGD